MKTQVEAASEPPLGSGQHVSPVVHGLSIGRHAGTHRPALVHPSPVPQVPQEVPHTGSGPQARPAQFGTQPQTPVASLHV